MARELQLGDRLRFLGFQSDMPRILSALDVVAMPSLLEGFPIVLLEAMAMEKPVVAADIDGVREAVIAGETTLLVPPKDSAALARALSSLLDQPARGLELGKAARRHVERTFSLERMLRETTRVYEELLKRRGDQP